MRNRKEKQQDILLVAANLFFQKGYERTTIEDITNVLGINKAMVYYYFPDKQHVLFEVIKTSIRAMINESKAIVRMNLSPKEKLGLLIQNHLERFTSKKYIPYTSQSELKNLSPKLLRRCIMDRDKYEAIFREVIGEGKKNGDFRNIDVNLTTALILGMLNSVILWYKSDGRLSMKDINKSLDDFVYHGILSSSEKSI